MSDFGPRGKRIFLKEALMILNFKTMRPHLFSFTPAQTRDDLLPPFWVPQSGMRDCVEIFSGGAEKKIVAI
jgi:hypothetical protein